MTCAKQIVNYFILFGVVDLEYIEKRLRMFIAMTMIVYVFCPVQWLIIISGEEIRLD